MDANYNLSFAHAQLQAQDSDWRTQLQPDARQRIVNKIMETLRRNVLVSNNEEAEQLQRYSVAFEEKIYAAATSQLDYLRKISLKMLTVERERQIPIQPNAASCSQNAHGPEIRIQMDGNYRGVAQAQAGEVVRIAGASYDGNYLRVAQAQASEVVHLAGAMDTADWRTQLQPGSRQRIINKIMETLRRHLPVYGPEGEQELNKVAVRFEEKIYTAATSQPDYLRKISLKMLTMETKWQNPVTNPGQPNDHGPGSTMTHAAKARSPVWEYFGIEEIEGQRRAKCFRCGIAYNYDPKVNGTSFMVNHLKKCVGLNSSRILKIQRVR